MSSTTGGKDPYSAFRTKTESVDIGVASTEKTIGLDNFLNGVTHNSNNTELLTADILEGATGKRLTAKFDRALRFAKFDDDTFIGRKTGMGGVDVLDRIEYARDLQTQLKEMGGSRGMERLAEAEQRKLKDIARNVYRDAGQAITEYKTVEKSLGDQQAKIITKVEERFQSAGKVLEREIKARKISSTADLEWVKASRENLMANRKAALDTVTSHFKDVRDHCNDAVDKLTTVVKDVEEATKISSAEYLKAGEGLAAKAIEGETLAQAGKGAAEAEGFISRISTNLSHGGMTTVKTVGLGAAACALGMDAGRRFMSAISTSDVQNGEQKGNPGDLVIAGTEALGVLGLGIAAAATHHR